jgi:hypothetical protein
MHLVTCTVGGLHVGVPKSLLHRKDPPYTREREPSTSPHPPNPPYTREREPSTPPKPTLHPGKRAEHLTHQTHPTPGKESRAPHPGKESQAPHPGKESQAPHPTTPNRVGQGSLRWFEVYCAQGYENINNVQMAPQFGKPQKNSRATDASNYLEHNPSISTEVVCL